MDLKTLGRQDGLGMTLTLQQRDEIPGIYNLRNKIGSHRIGTVRGVGYVLETVEP